MLWRPEKELVSVFFSDKGDLLCVIFDEVQAIQDRQILEFSRYRIEIAVKNSRVTYDVSKIKSNLISKKPVRRNRLLTGR